MVHAASDPLALSRICEPVAGNIVDGKVPPPIILNRFAGDGRLMRLEGRTNKDNLLIGVKRVAVSDDEVKQLCDQGFPVAALNVGDVRKARDGTKTVVPPLESLPTEFSIASLLVGFGVWRTYGNFWVPASMPSGHTYQTVDFTVTPNNYSSSGANSHFAAMTLAVSNSNFDHDFDAKGAIFYQGSNVWCGSGQNTMLQSWAIQNYTDGANPPCGAYLGCSNPVFNGLAPAPWTTEPTTCNTWSSSASKRFLVGANIFQQSVYWICQPGGTCPEYVSSVVDSTSSYFRSGGAGVAFVHVGSDAVSWSLYFTSVSSQSAP